MTTWRDLTFSGDASRNEALVIEDDRADVINDPLRWRILEILGEGKSVAEISQLLDVTDSQILYHLHRLTETGVVHLEENDAGPREWHCLPATGKIRVRAKASTSSGTQSSSEQNVNDRSSSDQDAHEQYASEPTGEAMPRDVASQFNQAFREAAEGLYGSTFQMSVNHNRARLSEAKAAEFNRRLLALIEEYFPPGKGDQSGIKYGFHGVLTPIDLHPIEESGIEE